MSLQQGTFFSKRIPATSISLIKEYFKSESVNRVEIIFKNSKKEQKSNRYDKIMKTNGLLLLVTDSHTQI